MHGRSICRGRLQPAPSDAAVPHRPFPGPGFRVSIVEFHFFAAALLLAIASPCAAQERLLERRFTPGESSRYRVELTLRAELDGLRPVRIGRQTYAEEFARTAEARLSWEVERRVLEVHGDASADIEERLSGFCLQLAAAAADDEEAGQLAASLNESLRGWLEQTGAAQAEEGVALRYRETPAGQIAGLSADAGPAADEAPHLLTLWLRRALRPMATLPPRPLLPGERWSTPRAAPALEGWSDVRGTESGVWLDFSTTSGQPGIRLHVVQQLQGRVAAQDAGDAASAEGRFHAESLSTLALDGARLLGATRSATREITRRLGEVPGLAERPRFRGRLLAQVQMEECDAASCRPACPANAGAAPRN
jgi:hypothetical protein